MAAPCARQVPPSRPVPGVVLELTVYVPAIVRALPRRADARPLC